MHLNLFWFRNHDGSLNFGDDLSPWLIRHLSPGVEVRWAEPLGVERALPQRTASWLKSQVVPRPSGHDIRYSRRVAMLRRPTMLGVGSIIARARHDSTAVWGSGILSRRDVVEAGTFAAVRGPRTREHLSARGIDAPEAMGDPALLVPLIWQANGAVEAEVSLIPHVSHHARVASAAPPGVRVVNLARPVPEVLSAIATSRVTLSTSLHGVIVSHAFGIPSVWIRARETVQDALNGDDVKFDDYFSSVDIDQTTPVDVGDIESCSVATLRAIVHNHGEGALPRPSVVQRRQADLLRTAPFPTSHSLPGRRARGA